MKKEVKILKEGKPVEGAVLLIESLGQVTKIKFIYKDIQIEKEGDSPFFVLSDLRKELEKYGYLPVCNGARIDVWPSGLSSVGYNAYIFRPNEKALLTDLVNIFESTDKIDLITTVEIQKEHHYNIVKAHFKKE